ncbi:MAG: YceI family protein, partial [Saprospiraceae bacterium]
AATSVFGQGTYSIGSVTMAIKGTSNLHDWESSAKEVRGKADLTIEEGKLSAINSLNVEVPVKSIKSTKGSIMDSKTYDALKADDHPKITFKLERATPIKQSGDGYSVTATGSLAIAGVTKKVDLSVKGKMDAGGNLLFSGSKKIKMTDYGIKPPTALMGTMTVGDEVDVVFSVTLKKV